MPTSADGVYLDSSAVVKLLLPERQSEELSEYLAERSHLLSAFLLRTEVLRAAIRAGFSPSRMLRVHRVLDTIGYIPADSALSDEAGTLQPATLRSLDAVHLATARRLRSRLAAFVTYDHRLAAAAAWHGMPVESPGGIL